MGILDFLVEELNKQEEIQKNGGVKRVHSEQYQIVQTKHGTFHNPVKKEVTEEAKSIEEMDVVIKRFIDEHWGTAIGESIYHKRLNTFDTDYDGIKDVYDEVMNY